MARSDMTAVFNPKTQALVLDMGDEYRGAYRVVITGFLTDTQGLHVATISVKDQEEILKGIVANCRLEK